MIPIRKMAAPDMAQEDYQQNFRPRKEVSLRLSLEQMKECLKNRELQEQIKLTSHFKFYLKQLFWLSWKSIDQNKKLSRDQKKAMFNELKEAVAYDSFDVTKALVCFIEVSFFLKSLSRHELYEIFWGSSIYDDYCAQVAYYEFNSRPSSH